jgi:hypothetical protein
MIEPTDMKKEDELKLNLIGWIRDPIRSSCELIQFTPDPSRNPDELHWISYAPSKDIYSCYLPYNNEFFPYRKLHTSNIKEVINWIAKIK